ncbi:MAG: M1 family metallopeptidase [Saprospiraceae bacterium]|nr:M1 family metallopeptidase [Saprospiraceae bacterium]
MAVRILNLITILCSIIPVWTAAQCDPHMDPPKSQRVANYKMAVTLDTMQKSVTGSQTLTWVNPSPDTIRELRFYMYVNAFKNSRSTFLNGTREIFGRHYKDRERQEWGYITVNKITRDASELTDSIKYIQPDNDNSFDQTVMSVTLEKPVMPYDSIDLIMDFITKLPKLLVRTGYSRDHFYHVTHWFPQIGVYEKDTLGKWGWNCHQFYRLTEFYADFGNYDVVIEAPDNLVIDGTGCRMDSTSTRSGWQKLHYRAEDVIDFAWVAYPYFHRIEDDWNGVQIRLLTPEEHLNLVPRFLHAVKSALSYLEAYIGPYPYASITMMDPPVHALSSGFMEYPAYITLGSFRYFPRGLRTIESLVMHEFTHQYFMAVVATNEKEEPWLDEGFVTYFEDRIMEATYGQEASLIDFLGYKISNSAFTRSEYTDLPDPSFSPLAVPAWELQNSSKGLFYSKTATVLKTMENLVGSATMDTIIQRYYERWKFRHPKGHDFKRVVSEVLSRDGKEALLGGVDRFFDQLIYGTGVCDYMVEEIENERVWTDAGLFGEYQNFRFEEGRPGEEWRGVVTVRRLGEVILPVDIMVQYEDGSSEMISWDGVDSYYRFEFEKSVRSCHIDPERKLMIDIDFLNNSLTLEDNKWPVRKMGVRSIYWILNLLQSLAFLV